MKTKTLAMLITILMCIPALRGTPAAAQNADGQVVSTGAAGGEGDSFQKDILRYTMLLGVYPVTFLIGVKAWDWGSNHQFKFGTEHWFGSNANLGGADKAGHIYAHYLVQRVAYSIFDYTENGKSSKWLYSLITTFSMGFMVEVGDGWSSKYGFSKEDLAVDVGGLLFGALLDYSPVMDAFFGLSVEYIPTKGFRERKKTVLDFENDYSGWKYMMNVKMAGFRYLWSGAPEFFRYVQFDLGYFTKGYSPHYDKDMREYLDPKREVFFGISVNLAEAASDFFPNKKSFAARASRKPFEYYHVPVGYRHEETVR